ncbi:unannotated protein [freshwater metagenome]|uniref:Unannotated protein n=1 Tax=freshwater metagenome TaxID=449393 RepID=A0A6J7EZQ5_9ZZZZ
MEPARKRPVGEFLDRVVWARLSNPAWISVAGGVCASLGLMIFMVRVLGASWPGQFKIFFPDSFSFKNAAGLTPFSPAFYAAERPIAFPTLLFLLGRSTVVTVVVQTLLYGLAYLFGVRVACRILRQPESRLLAGMAIIAIGLEPRFALWNTHILSESLGMTLAAVSVMLWWRFSVTPGVVRLRWAGVATIAWLTVRDSNVPPWMAVGVPALLIASFWWRGTDAEFRRSLRRWGVITLVVCLGVAVTQSANGRNRYATLNNVGLRVLPDAELTAWFVDQGMPTSPALVERTGSSSFDDSWEMLKSPALEEFRSWARGAGQRQMLVSYARFAPHWVGALYDDLPVLLNSDQSAYDAFHVAQRVPPALPGQLGGPTSRMGLLIWTLLAAVGLALAARRRGLQSIVLGLLLASCFIDLYMAYVGDSVEVQRHMVGPLSRMVLVMVLCIATGLDAAFTSIRLRKVGSA